MNIQILVLFAFVGILGSLVEARLDFFPYYRHGGARINRQVEFAVQPRLKREVDDTNGEIANSSETTMKSTINQATTKISSSISDSSTDPTISTLKYTNLPSSTIPPLSTTKTARSPTTLKSISDVTPTSISSTTLKSTIPSSDNTIPNGFQSRFGVSEPTDPTKSGPTVNGNAPSFNKNTPALCPCRPDMNYRPAYPGINSIPGSGVGPNYAWTSGGPDYGSAGAFSGASAGSFPGHYPNMPSAYPTQGHPDGKPTNIDNRGGFQDNAPGQGGYGPGRDPYFPSGYDYPGYFPPSFNAIQQQIRQIQEDIEAQHRANMDYHNRMINEGGPYYGGGRPQTAISSVAIGPHGGFQRGEISPARPGIESRFAEDLPPPSGNNFGVFSSSSSSSRTGLDGKTINHKQSTTGVNDNGKVYFRTVHD